MFGTVRGKKAENQWQSHAWRWSSQPLLLGQWSRAATVCVVNVRIGGLENRERLLEIGLILSRLTAAQDQYPASRLAIRYGVTLGTNQVKAKCTSAVWPFIVTAQG
jgi:hypothetical protein